MDKLEIMYLGKKGNVKISPNYLPEPLYFGGHGHKATIREDLGQKLIKDNPKMFMITRRVVAESELSAEATEALFGDEGLEGVDPKPERKSKPLSQRNKIDIASYALELDPPLHLAPEEMTKKEMLAAIYKQQE